MIQYANDRLNAWARWRQCRIDGGGRVVIATACYLGERIDAERAAESYIPIDDLEAHAIDRWIAMVLRPPQRLLILLSYTTSLPVDQIARRLRCHRDTYYARLHRVHAALLEHLGVRAGQSQHGRTFRRDPANAA